MVFRAYVAAVSRRPTIPAGSRAIQAMPREFFLNSRHAPCSCPTVIRVAFEATNRSHSVAGDQIHV